MLRVMVVEDEPMIVEGLKKIIESNGNFKVVDTAYDGVNGLEKIIIHNPDVCVVDIKIPGIDGLKLIEEVKKRQINTKFVILSGYSDFKFAQKAIEYGVVAYLLKPVNAEILINHLNKIYSEINKQKNLLNSINLAKDKVLENLITNSQHSIDISVLNNIYNLNLPWEKYQIALVQISTMSLLNNVTDNIQHKITQIKDVIDKFLKKYDIGYTLILKNNICILFKNFWYPFNSRTFNLLKNQIKSTFKEEVVLSVGRPVDHYSEIYLSLKDAQMLLGKNFLYGYKGIIYIWDDHYQETQTSILPEDLLKKQVKIAIELGNFIQLNDCIENLSKNFMHTNMSEEEIKSHFLNIYIEILNQLTNVNIIEKEQLDSYLSPIELRKFYLCENMVELKGLLKYLFSSIIEENHQTQNENIKDKIEEYIQKNYNSDAKLDTIAKIFGYNSSYFSKLFKRLFGENYTTYIDKIKIEKAKQFLIQGYKVYEVAKKVGYDDVDYFCSKFKKYVGIQPSSFKSKIESK
ncbi:response regulator [Caldicellulosiruptoraceae bacterium PP1]